MGIRNHKGTIRIISIGMIIIFALTTLISAFIFLRDNVFSRGDGNRQVIAVVNGDKIYRDDFEREFETLRSYIVTMAGQKKQQLAQMGIAADQMGEIPEDIMKENVFNLLLSNEILLSSAKELKVKPDNSVINKRIEEEQKAAGGKSNLIRGLAMRGFNLATYKEKLREIETIEKVKEKIVSGSAVSEDEVKKTYERLRYSNFVGKTYEEVKGEIQKELNSERSQAVLRSYISEAKEKAKIEIKSPEFKKYYENMTKTVAEKDGYKYTNASLNEQILMIYLSTPQGYSKDLAEALKKNFQSDLEKLIKISEKAKAVGIKPAKELKGVDELSSYSQQYYNYLIDTHKPSEEAMLERFNARKESYNTQNTIGGYVIGEEFVPTAKDIEAAKKQAEEAHKTITVENFAEKAKALSKDTASAVNGGSLGEEIDLSGLVPEFAEAVKKTEKGKITAPVRTEYGYHIIYVQDKNPNNENLAKVSHILIIPTVSEESKKDVIKRLTDLKAQLEAKKITWQEVETQEKYKFTAKEKFNALTKSDSIPGIGKNDPALMDRLFASKTGEILTQQEEFGYYLLTKVSEVPFKEAVFTDVKDRIRLEFAIEYANNEFENIK